MTVEIYEPNGFDQEHGPYMVNTWGTLNHVRINVGGRVGLDGKRSCPCCLETAHKLCLTTSPKYNIWIDSLSEYGMVKVSSDPLPQEPKEEPITVRGNGRQRIVDNGKHSWPGPKFRKGHR